MNGVTHSVMRILEYLRDNGHQALVIAPATAGLPESYAGFPVVGVLSVGLPGYAEVRIATTPQWRLERLFGDFQPDVVHLAAPIGMGRQAALACQRLGIPSVAIYQTDIPSYVSRYGLPAVEPLLWKWFRTVHELATMTLAPSTYAREQLLSAGVRRVGLWGRGVDSTRFHPSKRDEALRRELAPNGEKLIGYVGRLAPEKQVEDLEVLADLPDTRLVIVGQGPQAEELREILPRAAFLGQLIGDELPRVLASMDVFVAPGELETFCQTIQEAQASGVPPIAPARGGPIDLIDASHTGWLYSPGDLAGMRGHVRDLLGDDFKRAEFGRKAREAVEHRTWATTCEQLLGHYEEAILANRQLIRAA